MGLNRGQQITEAQPTPLSFNANAGGGEAKR